jgi:hypothetical protein
MYRRGVDHAKWRLDLGAPGAKVHAEFRQRQYEADARGAGRMGMPIEPSAADRVGALPMAAAPGPDPDA